MLTLGGVNTFARTTGDPNVIEVSGGLVPDGGTITLIRVLK